MKCPKCESRRMWIVTDTFDRAVYECADCSHREWPKEPKPDKRGVDTILHGTLHDDDIIRWLDLGNTFYTDNTFYVSSTNRRFQGKFTPDPDAKKKKKVQKKADRDAVEAFLGSLKEGK